MSSLLSALLSVDLDAQLAVIGDITRTGQAPDNTTVHLNPEHKRRVHHD